MADAPPRVALLRHPTPRIARGRCYGRLDIPLRAQAAAETAAMAARLDGFAGASVWTSPRLRCRIPARAIAASLGSAPPRIAPALRELDFGTWEGRAWDAIGRAPIDVWAADLLHAAPHGGETGAALITRVCAFWQALPPGAHVLVTHGGPLKILAALAAGRPIDLASPAPPYASVLITDAADRR